MLHFVQNDPVFNAVAALIFGLAVFDLLFVFFVFLRLRRKERERNNRPRNPKDHQ